MKITGNISEIAEQFLWKDSLGLVTKELGKSTGSEKIYVNLDSVPPNGYSTKYHSHSSQEEFFYILSGTGMLRLNDEEITVTSGDFLAKPGGKQIAHTFYNSGTESLLILDIGTVEHEDTCYYPDEDIYMHKVNGSHRVYKGEECVEGWSSEPNEDRS